MDAQTPLKMIVACMFCGGLAAGEARRAPCTAKDKLEQGQRIYMYQQMEGKDIVQKAEKARLT